MAGFLRRDLLVLGLAAAIGAALVAGCSESSSDSAPASEFAGPSAGAAYNSGGNGYIYNGSTGGAKSFAVSTGGLPAETKVTLAVEIPKASDRFVYAANPDRNSVAIIDPKNLSIQTVSVDSAPRGLQILPNRDAAVVVNTGSSTVSVLTTDSSRITSATTLAVMRGANVAAVAPDGKHALIYYDSTQPTEGPLTDSPQNMSALDLTGSDPVVYQVTVGYHPTAVNYAADSSKAFVVSDDGVSVVDIQHLDNAANRLSELIRLYDSTITSTADVLVAPNGTYAVAHQQNSTVLRMVDLTSRENTDLDLSTLFANSTPDAGAAQTLDVSDVELAPDGSFLLAVVRNLRTLVRVPIPAGFHDSRQVQLIDLPTDVLTGAVNIGPDGHYAVLYTTLDQYNEQHVSILDLASENIQTINLHKMVDAVAFDPKGRTAYILHVKSLGDPNQQGITQDQQTARQYGYSLVDLASAKPKLQLPDTQPGPIAALPDGSALFILFPDKSTIANNSPWSVQRVELVGFAVDSIGISSQPTGIGFVFDDEQVFVSQAQTDGRMTFINWTSLQIKSVAGYELNSSIWE